MENLGYYKPYRGTQPYGGRKRPDIVSLVIGLMITLIISGLATSCVSTKKYNAAIQARDSAETQLAKLKVDQTFEGYDHTTAMYEKENVIFNQSQQLFEKARHLDSLEAILLAQQQSLTEVNEMVSELSNQDWHVDEINGRLKLDLDADLIFPLNSSELTSEGTQLVADLANSIKSLDDSVRIQVVGHTDNQPFDASYYDNWDLSADRSLAVVRALEQEGISPAIISSVARGQFAPRANNDSAKGRMLNRRVEVQLIPVNLLNETIAELLKKQS